MVPVANGDSDETGGAAQPTQARRSPRVRRGLGKGLGALIPDPEPQPEPRAGRPLDVLFPDLAGNGAEQAAALRGQRAPVPRGGSARDLLSPRGTANVSRETQEHSHTASPQGANVSRETFGASQSGTQHTAGALRETHQDTPGSTLFLDDVSRETNDEESRTVPNSGTVSRETMPERPEVAAQPQSVSRETSDGAATLHSPVPGIYPHEPAANLLQSDTGEESKSGQPELRTVPGVAFAEIQADWIIPNLKQPREQFDEEELHALAESIREVGVLQPIVVRRITSESLEETGQAERLREALLESPEARYELVMGERRWRATQLAGLGAIPAIVRSTSGDDLLREALIENIHRVQLNPLEEAAAYAQLMEDFGYTQEEVANKVSKSRPQVANMLRLMKLPPNAQRMLAAGVITAGHARALLGMESAAEMEALAARIVAEGLSVRATEELVRFGRQGIKPQRPVRLHYVPTPEAQRIADIFAAKLDTSVTVSTGAKKGKLTIEFADQADLDRITVALGLTDSE